MPLPKPKTEEEDAGEASKPAPTLLESNDLAPPAKMPSSRAPSSQASARTGASMREAKRALLLERLEADKAIELARLELEKRCNAERYKIASTLLEEEERRSRRSSVSSGYSGRIAGWVSNVAAAASHHQTEPVPRVVDSTAVSDEIVKMRAALASGRQACSAPELTRSHIAARKALSKELPEFSGRPEDWPAFYANYRHSTEACGYRPEENLLRLQRCLKGAALEAVQSRLLLPASVPHVMETLRRRFGRPDLLVQMLIERAKKADSPRADKLDTLIHFGNLVQGLCDHIIAAELPEHLNNPCLLQALVAKLPADYQMRWAAFRRGRSSATLKTFSDYMEGIVEDASSVVPYTASDAGSSAAPRKPTPRLQTLSTIVSKTTPACPVCQAEHPLFRCPEFYAKSPSQRNQLIYQLQRCKNCLKEGHTWAHCSSTFSCRMCSQRHHTLLHDDPTHTNTSNRTAANAGSSSAAGSPGALPLVSAMATDAGQVILQTALVNIIDAGGRAHPARVLLDSASQPNLISSRLARRLRLQPEETSVLLEGAGKRTTPVLGTISTEVRARCGDFSLFVRFLVVDQIVSNLPAKSIELPPLGTADIDKLADPNFNDSQPIDIVLGACHYHEVFSKNPRRQPDSAFPVLLESAFGLVATGVVPSPQSNSSRRAAQPPDRLTCMLSLESCIERFWEAETLTEQRAHTSEENHCEVFYRSTTHRDESGRYIVSMPRKPNFPALLGKSKASALRRFAQLERRLEQHPELKKAYHSFMQEYVDLGHMRLVKSEPEPALSYYLPHHPVIKEASTTTKLRVVFDGSAKTSTGRSLNDALCVGPVVQDDILSIILRFRTHAVALVGDIAKMYRQVVLHENDRALVRILFRFASEDAIQTYELSTVTYGLAPSSFLATRTLNQVAEDEGKTYPRAASAVPGSFYVDDFIGGAPSVEEAILLRQELTELLAKGGFELRKWASNKLDVLKGLPDAQIATQSSVKFGEAETVKALGISWEPGTDQLHFTSNTEGNGDVLTKRAILSSIAKLFDPLGLVAPVVVKAKLFMQQLWLLGIGWDDPVPEEIGLKWKAFYEEWTNISQYKVPRYALWPQARIQLHIFTDASEAAYGACLYARCWTNNSSATITLLASKSRIAPLKRISLPRLELCAALLGARLYDRVQAALRLSHAEQATFWCDSTVVLHWLKSSPHTWATFVANRVSEIQTVTEPCSWRHIPGIDNPADLVSRGMTVGDFLQSHTWKHGPAWLSSTEEHWPTSNPSPSDDAELELKVVTLPTAVMRCVHPWFDRWSSYQRLLRVVAHCLLFARNARRQRAEPRCKTPFPTIPSLTPDLLDAAKIIVTGLAQQDAFSAELKALKSGQPIPRASPLRRLNPFQDENGILRVGGRLELAQLPYQAKHPAVLPKGHPFPRLVAEHAHQRLMHGSGRLLLSHLREEYWPLDGRRLVRQVARNCFRCVRQQPTMMQQRIGQLPASRITPSRPFAVTGVDYAGPLYLKPAHRRAASAKCYLCVFVCFTTKAVHLELVGDLSTPGFLSALRRFASRRGLPSHLYSDNGKNFEGAKRELAELFHLLENSAEQTIIAEDCANRGITWHLIPPKAPQFGGLWEAAVKTAKRHLFRQLGSARLSYEDYITVLHQIEAAMNSRPLLPLSEDPNDLAALTPAHFLIGASLTRVPEIDHSKVRPHALNAFQRLQVLVQGFWRHWSTEYLQELQKDTRVASRHDEIQPGRLVMLMDELLPPVRWPLARILALHPGADGLTRVVTLKTARGSFVRPITKIALLPASETR